MTDEEIIKELDCKFDTDEFGIKFNQFIRARRMQKRIEDPLPQTVLSWLEQAIIKLANMLCSQGHEVEEAWRMAESNFVSFPKRIGFKL